MERPASKLLAFASGLLLLLTGGFAGALLGGLYVKLFVPKTGMGWDQLADLLGGLMLGGLLGLGLGGVLAAVLDGRRRWLASVVLAAVAVGVIGVLVATRPG